MKIPIQTAQIHFQNLSYLIQQVSIFFIKSSKKDNYQLENKEIKNLPPNLKKNRQKVDISSAIAITRWKWLIVRV